LFLDEISEDLSDFGLTGNQAKVYLTLVKLGVASTSQLARSSKVRREEVYRLMPKLQQLGLVEKILGKPIKYKSVPPRKGLAILLEHEREGAKEKIAVLTEKRSRLLKQLKSVRAKRTVEEEPRFVLISDRKQALSKMVMMIRSAKREIDVVTSEYGLRYGYTIYADSVMKAIRKGVKVRFLSEINEVDEFMLKILNEIKLHGNFVEMRHADNLTSSILIADNLGVFVGIPLKPTMKKHADLWTDSPAYVDAMKSFFDRIWQDSVDIKSRIEYLQTGKPIERTEAIKGKDALYEKLYAVNSRVKVDKFGLFDGSAIELVLHEFTSANIELKKRRVRVRYLTNVADQNLQAAEEMSKQFEVRHTDTLPFGGLLTETEAIFSWILKKDMPDAAIYSNNAEFVHILWKIAENAWDNAIDAQLKIDEIKTGKPVGIVSKPIIEHLSKNQKIKV